ncbi:MAG TPA: FAD-binding oxidoreductase [Gaiellaceae bacterium]|nr:FAD-binding oxidoreductase [Gaiellaceae bacterium]
MRPRSGDGTGRARAASARAGRYNSPASGDDPDADRLARPSRSAPGGVAAAGTVPYWLAERRAPLPGRGAPRGAAVDVAVVGGGVTGCSCALALAERGLRVRLLEAREVAGGASGRNGGFALRGAALPYDRARVALGAERARLLWRLSERALDRLAELAGDACRRVGSLRLAADDAEAAELAAEEAALREDGFAVERLDPLPPPLERLYAAGLVHPGDAAIHPARWVRRLAARAAEAGAEIVEGRRVATVDPERLSAGAVVVAVDGLGGELLPELAAVVAPRRGQVLVTEPLRRRLYERPHYARRGYDYWQQLPDGRLVAGGRRDASFETEATAVEETTPLVQELLEDLVAALVGGRPRVTHRWAGIWGETPDLLPLAGRAPGREGVWVAGGYSGHGNVLGLACGELVARAVAGDAPPELALFDPARFVRSERDAGELPE